MAPDRETIADMLVGVDLSAPSPTALRPLSTVFAHVLGYPPELVYATSVSKPGNLKKQAGQSERSRAATLLVVVHRDGELVASTVEQAPRLIGPGRFDGILVVAPIGYGGPDLQAVVQPNNSSLCRRRWKTHPPPPAENAPL